MMILPKKIQKIYNNATCLYNKDAVETALDHMAKSIELTLSDADPILLTVLKGGIVLTGNILTRLDFPLEIDNIHATRYQGNTVGGELEWRYEPKANLKGRTVLVLDDILDLGITLQAIVSYCYAKGAKKVLTGVLLDKKVQRPAHGLQKADFVALEVDNRFVFGYGLDYQEYLRNAPGIFEVNEEDQ